ncbi:MAG: dephospho-CoA kinase [Ferruginibacter sp.]|nr:dephospho-CoA kinase [Ferruginibacter sp.]
MLRIGLTGGMGSGKTTVAKIFEVLGIPVYYADDAAKRLMNDNAVLREKIIQHFGADTYHEGQLQRPNLSKKVFNDPEKLALLNSLVHPVTIADAESWMQSRTAPYAIKEAALIFETDAYKYLDLVIGVNSPLELRVKRSMDRDHIAEEEVRSRMARQMDEAEKLGRCDTVFINDEQSLLIPQVIAFHEHLLSQIINPL